MVSIGRTAGFCCCRCSPAIQSTTALAVAASTSRAFPSQRQARGSASAGFALLKALSAKLAAQQLLKDGCFRVAGGFATRTPLSRASFNLRAVAARAYYSESGFQYGRSNAPVEQYGHVEQDRDEFPRPPLIPWEKDLANAVQLIGNVGKDVDIKYLDTGKIVAKSSLAVKKIGPKNEDPSWFELEFWDELAEIAAHHVKKGDRIFVTGRIIVDRVVTEEVNFTKIKVAVSNLCFVETYSGQRQTYGEPNATEGNFGERSSNSWQQQGVAASFAVTSPEQNRNNQPVAAQQSTESTGPVSGTPRNYAEEALATEKRWQEFFADPSQWWDNRTNKRNPKSPDFKHKSTQEVLWLNSWTNPPWVAQQVAAWEEKKVQSGDMGGARQRSNTNNLSSFKDSDFI